MPKRSKDDAKETPPVVPTAGAEALLGEDDFDDLNDALSEAPEPAAATPPPPPKAPAVPPAPRLGNPEDRVGHLSRVNMFAGLTPLYLKRIAALCDEEVHAQGAFLFKEGEAGDKLYIIIEGAVRISRHISGMGEEALAVLRAGDYFGEMALIDTFPRSADACAHEPCRVLVIDKQKLEDLLFVDRDLAYDLLWNFVRTLSGRLRQTNDKMTFLAVTNKF
ncbi:MAG: cyclic nucleotide-binding domain-containing protein [Deltaproteobacteria bacterium]|nr:cyclic nucleotide-binding domain-containing protein [Deltaproteobacteria bacterium]